MYLNSLSLQTRIVGAALIGLVGGVTVASNCTYSDVCIEDTCFKTGDVGNGQYRYYDTCTLNGNAQEHAVVADGESDEGTRTQIDNQSSDYYILGSSGTAVCEGDVPIEASCSKTGTKDGSVDCHHCVAME